MKPMQPFGKNQAGFTLVEIAIVLVIIGLLLGGILKGQEMITQAKIKNIVNDMNGMSAAIYSYQDRYRALPGDELDATTKSRWGATTGYGGDGNGTTGGIRGQLLSAPNADVGTTATNYQETGTNQYLLCKNL